MIFNIEQKFSKSKKTLNLKISHLDKDGKVKFLEKELVDPQVWKLNRRNYVDTNINWDKRTVTRTSLKSRPNKFQLLDIINDYFSKDEIKLLRNLDNLKVQSIDIEVEVGDEFPTPEKAEMKITTIAIATTDRKVLVLGTKALNFAEISKIEKRVKDYLKDFGDWDFKYKHFDTEYNMLHTFMCNFMPTFSTIIGWNWFGFDWLYLVNRSKKLGIKPEYASRSKRLLGNDNIPQHTSMFDYMDLYSKYEMKIVKESKKLDYLAGIALGVKKLTYNGTLQNLYENDFLKYVAYNAIDAALVVLIHEKQGYLNVPLTLGNDYMVSANKVISPVAVTEHIWYFTLRESNKVIADPFKEKVKKSYGGGYVKVPNVGIHNAVMANDYASLYPNVERTFCISPETFVGKFDSEEMIPKKYKNDKYIITVNNCVFEKVPDSLTKVVIDKLYSERKYYKNRYLEIEAFLNKHGKL